MAAIIAGLLVIAGFVVWMFFSIALRAFVLTQLWAWFVVPFGIMPITFVHAAGISLIVAFLTYESNDADSEDKNAWVGKLLKPIIFSLVAWGFGAIYHHYM